MTAHPATAQDPDDARPHVLYVAWGFPPCRSGGVYRALATANRFVEQGWRVTVLTADRDTFLRYTGADVSLEQRVHPDVEVVRVPFTWPAMESDLGRWSYARMARPREWRRLRVLRDTVPFPEVGYGPWRRRLERTAEQVHARRPVDLTVATANPHVSFTAAHRLRRRHGVPYVLDYRDAWLLDVFSGRRLHPERSRAARWERRLVGDAAEVWFVNEPIRRWHEELYPAAADRMHVVANGYDADLAPAIHERGPVGDRPLVFGYLGTVTPKVPLAELVRGWRLARRPGTPLADAELRVHGYLGYYATPRPDLQAVVDSGADAGVRYAGPVGKGDVGEVYDTFDVQLLVLGSGRYVTSGKIFEYLATGLPIVSVHDPGNAASDVLRGHPLWFPVADLSEQAVAAALTAAARAARTADARTRHEAREFGRRFSRELQLDPRISALRNLVRPAGSPVAASSGGAP